MHGRGHVGCVRLQSPCRPPLPATSLPTHYPPDMTTMPPTAASSTRRVASANAPAGQRHRKATQSRFPFTEPQGGRCEATRNTYVSRVIRHEHQRRQAPSRSCRPQLINNAPVYW